MQKSITYDHCGHDRINGTDLRGRYDNALKSSIEIKNASIKDVAPTAAKLLGVNPDDEWEGKCLT